MTGLLKKAKKNTSIGARACGFIGMSAGMSCATIRGRKERWEVAITGVRPKFH